MNVYQMSDWLGNREDLRWMEANMRKENPHQTPYVIVETNSGSKHPEYALFRESWFSSKGRRMMIHSTLANLVRGFKVVERFNVDDEDLVYVQREPETIP